MQVCGICRTDIAGPDLRYNVTGQSTGRDHFPEFIARSRSNPSSELRDWRAWKNMWKPRARIAVSEHINQHGRGPRRALLRLTGWQHGKNCQGRR